jgi:hypothetical protein
MMGLRLYIVKKNELKKNEQERISKKRRKRIAPVLGTGNRFCRKDEKWARNGQNRLIKPVNEIKVAQGM